jgi:hypothetical protein
MAASLAILLTMNLAYSQVESFEQSQQTVHGRFIDVIGPIEETNINDAKLLQLWGEYWPSSFSNNLPSGTNPEVASGANIPAEYIPPQPDDEPLYAQLEEGTAPGVGTSEIQRAMLGRHTIAMAYASARPNDLALLLEPRMNELPPKEGDLITSRIINDVLESVGNQEEMTEPQLARWSGVAAAQSAIYRLLAVRSFGAITVEPDRLLTFCGLYDNETDLTILTEVVERIATVQTQAAHDKLLQIATYQNTAGRPSIAEKAQVAVASLAALLAE